MTWILCRGAEEMYFAEVKVCKGLVQLVSRFLQAGESLLVLSGHRNSTQSSAPSP